MKLSLSLPGYHERVPLIGGIGDMEDVCVNWSGEYDTPILNLCEMYHAESNTLRKRDIADEIRDQAYYFADAYFSYDEEAQQRFPLIDFAEMIYEKLINFATEYEPAIL